MEENNSFKVTFIFPDYDKNNIYSSFRFETLLKDPIKIETKKIDLKFNLNEELYLNGNYDELIHLIPEKKEFEEKEIIITLYNDINNLYRLNINEIDGDCNVEINSMWDIDYDDKTSAEERKIPDLKYDGKIIEDFEALYERKRWNILNAKVEKFESNLFSDKTIKYIKNNKNKSFKYDILLCKDNIIKCLSEKIYNKIIFFNEADKENLKNKLKPLATQLREKANNLEKQNISKEIDKEEELINKYMTDIFPDYKDLAESFNLYNNKWNLNKFSDNDFQLFLLFSQMDLYYKPKITQKYIEQANKKYEELKNKVISDESLNLIEKTRIICAFSKFCSSKLLKGYELPELFITKNLAETDPYKMAIEKYKEIIKGLKESSGYFKKLLLFDMSAAQIINDWDFETFKINNLKKITISECSFSDFQKKINIDKRKITFPSISMLTLNQVKQHSLNLLPKFFFKVVYAHKFNAVSDAGNHITFFNESRLLYSEGMKDNIILNPKGCVLPIMIEISHETLSHVKIRYSNSSCLSPLLNPIKDKNKLLCPNDFKTESGYIIEYLFADTFEELNFIKKRNEDLFELTDPKYWIDINFNKMKKFNKEKMEKKKEDEKFDEDYNNLILDDKRYDESNDDNDDEDNIGCIFHKYNYHNQKQFKKNY